MKQYGGNLALNGSGNPLMAGLGLAVGGTLYGIGSLMDTNRGSLSDVQETLTSNGFILGEPFTTVLRESGVETVADYSYYLDNKNLRADLKVNESINCKVFEKTDNDWFLRNEYIISKEEELNSFKEKLTVFVNN
jgi:hypothetical protein